MFISGAVKIVVTVVPDIFCTVIPLVLPRSTNATMLTLALAGAASNRGRLVPAQ
jgi:hypothetical protein